MSWYENRSELFYEEQKVIEKRYPSLHFRINECEMYLTGKLHFRAVYDGEMIEDAYDIDISYPDDYPEDVPLAREIGNRIEKDYHCFSDGTLCLGTFIEVYRRFLTAPNTLSFIERLLIPFLYRYSYITRFGTAPFPECPHGASGIVQWHQDYFEIDDNRKILRLLLTILEDRYRGHLPCPCGSNEKLRKCHGPKLMDLFDVPKKYLRREAEYIFSQLANSLSQ